MNIVRLNTQALEKYLQLKDSQCSYLQMVGCMLLEEMLVEPLPRDIMLKSSLIMS